LQAAARTGRVTPAKHKQTNRERKKRRFHLAIKRDSLMNRILKDLFTAIVFGLLFTLALISMLTTK
jgi:hypothetical protein